MIKLCIILIFIFAATCNSHAAPGDILYVQSDVVNMRKGPSKQHPVVLQLRKGHKLMEFQRQGRWVEVGADRTGGRSGWIYSSLISKEFKGEGTTAPADKKFQKFKAAFAELNARIKRKSGFTFFTKAENLGDGIIQVSATDKWLGAPRTNRESNLRTIFQLWDAAEGSGLPIAVYVVDKHGNQHMSMKR